MCSTWDIEIVSRALAPEEVAGATILEVGSRDVNGSVRPELARRRPAKYVGVDLFPGPGVDVLCPAEGLVERFGEAAFDVVISTELIEHVRDWRVVISNLKRVVKPGGLLLVTTRSYGVDFHRHPFDYWRYERADFEVIFGDFTIEHLALDPVDPGVFVRARKPMTFAERDLSEVRLYSILRQRRRREATRLDTVLFQVRYRLVRLLMDLLPKSWRQTVHQRMLR